MYPARTSVLLGEDRWFRLIQNVIECLKLDLSGAVVLTEMGKRPLSVDPLIAAAAGAEKVIAVAKDSRYGSAENVLASGMALARRWKLHGRIEPISSITAAHVAQADVVTNLGFVRPIDAQFVSAMKGGAVVAHMCEAWEIRPEDVDVAACRARMCR